MWKSSLSLILCLYFYQFLCWMGEVLCYWPKHGQIKDLSVSYHWEWQIRVRLTRTLKPFSSHCMKCLWLAKTSVCLFPPPKCLRSKTTPIQRPSADISLPTSPSFLLYIIERWVSRLPQVRIHQSTWPTPSQLFCMCFRLFFIPIPHFSWMFLLVCSYISKIMFYWFFSWLWSSRLAYYHLEWNVKCS